MKFRSVFVTVMIIASLLTSPVEVFAATNELTGLEVSENIASQRPVAIMVDNEKTALNHYGVGEADIVYEIMNSTKNGRITRLMCLYKDWGNLKQTGSIRSTRSTNVILSDEYNAVVIHDGGPFYIDSYFAQPYADHLSGGFTRINNGKAREFTEYVYGTELTKRFASAKLSTTYTYTPERNTHFLFKTTDTDISGTTANTVDMSSVFTHNKSLLTYNTSTKSYDYYEYGSIHKDAEDSQVATFKNVILQNVAFSELDTNGYLVYNVIGEGTGYYLTNGKVIPITWKKGSEQGITHYYDSTGTELTINKGKTYIGILPSDTWNKLVIK